MNRREFLSILTATVPVIALPAVVMMPERGLSVGSVEKAAERPEPFLFHIHSVKVDRDILGMRTRVLGSRVQQTAYLAARVELEWELVGSETAKRYLRFAEAQHLARLDWSDSRYPVVTLHDGQSVYRDVPISLRATCYEKRFHADYWGHWTDEEPASVITWRA